MVEGHVTKDRQSAADVIPRAVRCI